MPPPVTALNTPFVIGTGGADRLSTSATPALLQGGAGDDTYDLISAGQGVWERPDEGTDTILLASAGGSFLLPLEVEILLAAGVSAGAYTGNAGSNRMEVTGSQADVLDGGAGNDTLSGGGGNDTYVVDASADQVIEADGGGTDLVRSSAAAYVLPQFVENGTVAPTGRPGDLTGNGSDNLLTGNAATNRLLGLAGNDTLRGAEDPAGVTAPDLLDGGAGDDSLTGAGGQDTLLGGLGNDFLEGGNGRDSLVGGAGNDTYKLADDGVPDDVVEAAGGGTDVVQTTRAQFVLPAEVEVLIYLGSVAFGGTGNAAGNRVVGGSGADTLAGLAGNDVLDGLHGADRLEGGAGNDTYVVDDAADLIVERPGEGIDTVQASRSWTLGDQLENLVLLGLPGPGAPALNGRGNALANGITGNDGANLLEGFGGDDLLDGRGGADTLIGGAGNDTYRVDNPRDAVVEAAGPAGGTDLVRATVSVALAPGVENLDLLGRPEDDLAALGNALANRINGDAGDNFIDGGAGADTMAGGAGDDVYTVDAAGDQVVELLAGGRDVVLSGVNALVLFANVEDMDLLPGVQRGSGNALDNVLRGNAGANELFGLAGKDVLLGRGGNDRLVGDAGDDLLDGGRGADTMAGGAGNDTYFVDQAGDVVDETVAGSAGIDVVRTTVNVSALAGGVENLELLAGAVLGVGNALDNVITGNGRANVLAGGAGNDLLDGGAGPDQMNGGAGNDTFVVDDADDQVIDDGGGIDLVRAFVSVDVSTTGVEQVVLLGAGAIGATGNELANTLTGNDAANELIGGLGNDTLVGNGGADVLDGMDGIDSMAGGAGDDTYFVNVAGDRVVELPGGGRDRVVLDAAFPAPGVGLPPRFELPAEVEDLSMGNAAGPGTGAVLVGNALHNRITGNALSNRLEGRDGNDLLDGDGDDDPADAVLAIDTLVGGAGDDTYVVNGPDVIVELASAGTDTIRLLVDAGPFSLSTAALANVENLEVVADPAGARSFTGNALSNHLRVQSPVTAGKAVTLEGGGGGSDTYEIDAVANGGVVNVSDTGAGTDLARFGLAGTGAALNVGAGVPRVVVEGGAAGALSATLTATQVLEFLAVTGIAPGDTLSLSGLDATRIAAVQLLEVDAAVQLAYAGAGTPAVLDVRLERVGNPAGADAAVLDFIGPASLVATTLTLDSRGGVANALQLPDAAALQTLRITGDTALDLTGLPDNSGEAGPVRVEGFTGGQLGLFTQGLANQGLEVVVSGSDLVLALRDDAFALDSLDLAATATFSRVRFADDYADLSTVLRGGASASLELRTGETGSIDAGAFKGDLVLVHDGTPTRGLDFLNAAVKDAQGSFTLILGPGDDTLSFGRNLGNRVNIDAGANDAGDDADLLSANVSGLGVGAGPSGALSLAGLEVVLLTVDNPATGGTLAAVIDASGIVDAGGASGTTLRVGDLENLATLANAIVEIQEVNLTAVEAQSSFEGSLRVFARTDLLPGSGALDVFLGGGKGNDELSGGNGDDTVSGGGGNDTLSGGFGEDRFVFTAASRAALGSDVILDFEPGADRLVLDAALFTGLSTNAEGVLDADELVTSVTTPAGSPATAGKLVYVPSESPAGRLYFDPLGDEAPVLIATLGAGVVPSAADVLVLSLV